MTRRLFIAAVAGAACTIAAPASVPAQRLPLLVTPTTTTTTLPVIVARATTTTTSTSPVLVAPTTTAPPTTSSPSLATPTTTARPTTTSPALATPTTTTRPGDLVQGTVPADDVGPGVPIGEIDTNGAIPDGLDLAVLPGTGEAPTPPADLDVVAGLSCAYQCIESGVAYPRGFGALLVVETYVPAQLFLSVVVDNADYDLVDSYNSPGIATDFSWALDHLDPGQRYYVTAAATDENGHSAYAYGSFVTLDERDVEISIGDVTVSGGPNNIVGTSLYLQVDGDDPEAVPPSPNFHDVDRHLDLRLWTVRWWEGSVCESWVPDADSGTQGDSDDSCLAWNSAPLDDVDLDAIPAASAWVGVTLHRTFQTAGGDDALPGGYGDPRFFHFSAPVTLTVSYH